MSNNFYLIFTHVKTVYLILNTVDILRHAGVLHHFMCVPHFWCHWCYPSLYSSCTAKIAAPLITVPPSG